LDRLWFLFQSDREAKPVAQVHSPSSIRGPFRFSARMIYLASLVAQEQAELPRYATWQIGEFGEFGDGGKSTNGLYRIEYSPDGRFLATRNQGNVVVVYDLSTRKSICEVEGHEQWIETINFSPDGNFFVTASGGSDDVKIWKTQTGSLESKIDAGGSNAFFDQTGELINVLGETHVQTYSWPGLQMTQQRKWKGGAETAKVMSQDGRYVIAFRKLNKQFYATMLVDTVSNSTVALAGASANPRTAKVSPDNRWIAATYDRDPKIRLWSIEDPKAGRYTLNGHKETVQSLSFSPDNRFLVSSGWDQHVIAWDLLSRQAIKKFEGHQGHVNATACAPFGFAFSSGASGAKDCSLIAWDMEEILFAGHDLLQPKFELSAAQQFDSIWKSLGAGSLRLSMAATSEFAAGGDFYLDTLEERIEDTISIDRSGTTEEYLRQLNDPRYKVRQRATEALLKMVREVETRLRAELRRTSLPEVKYRISMILAQEPPKAKSDLVVARRWYRIILALEKIRSERSQAILKAVSLGHRDANIASHALASYQRNLRRQELASESSN